MCKSLLKVLKPNSSEMTRKHHSQVSNVQSKARQAGPDRQTSHRNTLHPLEGFTASPACLRASQHQGSPVPPWQLGTHELITFCLCWWRWQHQRKSSNNPVPCKNHMQLSRTLSKTTFFFCYSFFPQPCLLLQLMGTSWRWLKHLWGQAPHL